jgi:hypothetical protein
MGRHARHEPHFFGRGGMTLAGFLIVCILQTMSDIKALDNFYEQQDEPIRGCLLALRAIILKQDDNIIAILRYGMPCFCYKGKMFVFLWVHKKLNQPYILFVEGHRFNEPFLLQEKRSRMKIMLFDANKDIPVKKVTGILKKALDLYRNGVIKIKDK